MNGVKSPVMTYRYCTDNFGVGPTLSTRLGDTASILYLQSERVVAYVPNPFYLGPDFFTYIIYDGLGVQTHSGAALAQTSVHEITTHVRFCRKFQSQLQNIFNATIHPICQCDSSESGIINNITLCESVRTAICADKTSRYAFLNLCLSCEAKGPLSFVCQSETVRAVGMLRQRGIFASSLHHTFITKNIHVFVQGFVRINPQWIA